jgi:hypothetical protein
MAVTSCTLVDDWCGLHDRQFTYGAKYRVKTDTRNDAALEVLLGAASASPDALPAYFSTYSLNGSSDPNAFAQDYDPKRIKQDGTLGRLWEITVNWGPLENPSDDFTTNDNPITRPVRIEPYSEEIEEVVEEGWCEDNLPGIGVTAGDFVPIVNPAGQEPGTPLTRPRRIGGLKFIINVATIADYNDLRDEFENMLNSATFYDAPAKTVLCRTIDCSPEMFAGGTSYREVSICTLFREEGWAVPLVNRGYKYLGEVEATTTLIQATEWSEEKNRRVPVAEPVNLELDGTATPDGQVGTVTHWRINGTAVFSGMGVGG